jgi:hypothetical protein
LAATPLLGSGFKILSWFPLRRASVSGTVRVPMLKLDFLRRYDVADMLMLAASVLVVVTILVAV